MQPSTPSDDIQATGTLPVTGADAVPVAPDVAPVAEAPAWLEEARSDLTIPGRYLAWEDGARRIVVPLRPGHTRIGRSLSAEVRFDDATVSRRHALVDSGPGGCRVLDDRSLNGIQVNGERVEERVLRDGDMIVLGRHVLYYLDTATVGSAVPAASAALAE